MGAESNLIMPSLRKIPSGVHYRPSTDFGRPLQPRLAWIVESARSGHSFEAAPSSPEWLAESCHGVRLQLCGSARPPFDRINGDPNWTVTSHGEVSLYGSLMAPT